jgi:hypothetical protein
MVMTRRNIRVDANGPIFRACNPEAVSNGAAHYQ